MLFSSGSVKRDQLGRDHDVGAREPVERVHPVEEAGRGHDAELLMLEVDERRDLLKILERVRAGESIEGLVPDSIIPLVEKYYRLNS